jgi:hypothetical protein
MRNRSRISLIAAATVLAGCYHATIVTGLPAGTTGVHKEWVATWVFGIVPPSEDISSAKECPNGVAKVETQWSFLNGLVHVVTFNIYGPMQVDVTCASSSKMASIPAGAEIVPLKAKATADEVKAAFLEAASRSARDGVPVYVQQ